MENSVDPDLVPHSVMSDLGLRCFSGRSVPELRLIIVHFGVKILSSENSFT